MNEIILIQIRIPWTKYRFRNPLTKKKKKNRYKIINETANKNRINSQLFTLKMES